MGMYTPLESFVNMGKKDYRLLTESQLKRDGAFLDSVVSRFIVPLLNDLANAIPGYFQLSEWERFVALMRMNQAYFDKSNGNALCLDFGYCEEQQKGMRGWVFPHVALFTGDVCSDDAISFHPLFQESQAGMVDTFEHSGKTVESIERLPTDFHITFDELPLPYRIAVIALHIRQSIITTREGSCRLAAGWDTQISIHRQYIQPLITEGMQRYGWSVLIRDTIPENKMGEDIVRRIKTWVETDLSLYPAYLDTADGNIPTYAEHEPDKKQRRANRETTNNLRDFFTRYLPSENLYVGRSGEGKRISQAEAFELFDEMYPGQYCDCDSFFKSYYTQRKKWEGQ